MSPWADLGIDTLWETDTSSLMQHSHRPQRERERERERERGALYQTPQAAYVSSLLRPHTQQEVLHLKDV